MKGKFKKAIMAALCVGMMLGLGTTAYADAGTIKGTITTARITGSYTYGSGGHQVKVELIGYESKADTGIRTVTTSVVNGSATTASASRNVDAGYKYYLLHVHGYVDGERYAALVNLTP